MRTTVVRCCFLAWAWMLTPQPLWSQGLDLPTSLENDAGTSPTTWAASEVIRSSGESSIAALPSAMDGSVAPACGSKPGWFAYGEYLNWQARRRGMDYGTFVNPVFLTPTESMSLDYGRDSGLRLGLGYRFATEWDVSWNYTYFRTEADGFVDASARPGDALMVSRSASPLSLLDQTIDSIAANSQLTYNVHDLEAGRWFELEKSVAMRVFGGFRWAMLDQDFNSSYAYTDNDEAIVNAVLRDSSAMQAYGLRMGLEGQWLSSHGLRLFGRSAGSVLVGNFRTRQYEVDDVDGTIIDYTQRFAQAVPVLEVAAGMGWTRGNWDISGGYELSAWFNMAELGRASQDLIFDGFFLRLTYSR